MPASRRTTVLVKVAVILVLLAGVAYLFMRSLDVTRAEPYTVRAEHLGSWALTPDPGAEGDRAVLALAPPAELPLRLFRQVFSRAGESLSTPNMPGIALVLASELAGTALPVDGLVALAREAGLDRARLSPRCMGYRRESQPGSTRQLYFVLFDMPEFLAFRQALAARVTSPAGSPFTPEALSPVMMLAAAPDFARWMPIVANPERDCVAPVVAE
ncbi:MAG: hypothetical protein AB7H81_13070 [Vicinamibacterales bacterium]